ncbi:MAG: glutathione S-transferase family protein [Betaproteobacteria bacterium]|nr:glutathione S-transferase family protein [Betaproteobacteria bacterium]
MSTPILHHYDFSPFAEKIRLAFGLKGLRWRSVIAPSVMPKPQLVALTGGYRHIPVLQIGADVFCDTRTIARELDRRYPSPPLMDAGTRGVATAIEAWAERDLFWPVARYVSGVNAETVDAQLHADRAALRGKPVPSTARLKSVARRNLGHLRAELPTIERMLAAGSAWLLGQAPGQGDLAVYHALWFLSALPIDCSHELAAYPATRAWMARVAAIGHGTREELPADEALAIAARTAPEALRASIGDDALPAPGARVGIRPDDYATAAIEGVLAQVDRDDIAILRADATLGEVMVHFPRVGYTLREL